MRSGWLSLVVLAMCASLSVRLKAADYTTEQRFHKTVQEVFDAAEKAAVRMGARIEKREAETGTLIFGATHGVKQSIQGYRAVLITEAERNTGKTIARLGVDGISWSQSSTAPPRNKALAGAISQRFFEALEQELGLCKKCAPPPIRIGVGVTDPVPRPDPRKPN